MIHPFYLYTIGYFNENTKARSTIMLYWIGIIIGLKFYLFFSIEDQKLVAIPLSFADDKHMFNLKQNQMKKNYLFGAAFVLALMGTACNNSEDLAQDVPNALKVTVKNNVPESRAIVHGTTLPVDARIGVTLVNEAGGNYDGVEYSNIEYKTTTGTDWAIVDENKIPLLSSTAGKAIAYYPYADGINYAAIEVATDDQEDWLYSGWTTADINNANPVANFTMNHGLSAMRVILKKGAGYGATAIASTITAESDFFVESAVLNGITGALTGHSTGKGNVTVNIEAANQELTTDSKHTDILVVPAAGAGTDGVDFTINISDGVSAKNYTVNVPLTTLTDGMKQGKCYQITLTLTAEGFEVSTVAVTDWSQELNAGSGSLTPGA